MTTATLILQAETDGVKLALSQSGTIKATGHGDAINRWLPLIREHKQAIVAVLESPRVTTALLESYDANQALALVTEPYHGLSLAELKTAAGDDWPAIEHDADMLKAFAHALLAQAMRERCEVPSHYTQVVNCDGCGPVWLWQGSPDRVMACPWCFVRVQGKIPPRA